MSLNAALLAVLPSLSVSAMMSGLKEPDFSAHVLNLMTGHVYIEDHVFLNAIKSVCIGTRHSSCSKCFILSALSGPCFIAGVQLLKLDSFQNCAAVYTHKDVKSKENCAKHLAEKIVKIS